MTTHRILRAAVLTVVCTGVATAAALPLRSTGALTAASLYTLAVVAAAAFGGWWAGMVTAIASFLLLNFLFVAPFHTFDVAAPGDVAALVVFLVVSATVGSLVAKVERERELALRREQETRVVGTLTEDLLSGMPLEQVMQRFATAVQERLDVAWVRIAVPEAAVDVEAGEPTGSSIELPAGDGTFTVGLHGPRTRRDEEAAAVFARQLTLAVQRAQLDEQVRSARLDSERNEARAALFSSVTHDLRTPLASIKASLTSLLGDEASFDAEQRAELLTTALEETDRLDRLVGNLLDLARVRAGALQPSRQPIEIEDMVASVLTRMRRRLEAVTVRTVIRPDLPVLQLDPVQLDQAITNVMENALRVSPPGGEIAISAARWRGAVQLKIADQGPGIPEDERERVFEAFYRGDRAGGSGLGLAITHAIVAVHGGRVWIEGTPGGGTTVVIEMPVEVMEP